MHSSRFQRKSKLIKVKWKCSSCWLQFTASPQQTTNKKKTRREEMEESRNQTGFHGNQQPLQRSKKIRIKRALHGYTMFSDGISDGKIKSSNFEHKISYIVQIYTNIINAKENQRNPLRFIWKSLFIWKLVESNPMIKYILRNRALSERIKKKPVLAQQSKYKRIAPA